MQQLGSLIIWLTPDHICVMCGTDLPEGSRSHRLTCSDACRQRKRRYIYAVERSERGPIDLGDLFKP